MMKVLNTSKSVYTKRYKQSNSWLLKKLLKLCVNFIYLRRYFVNFSADALKVSLYWLGVWGLFFLPIISYIWFWPVLAYYKKMLVFTAICAYFGCYFEVDSWRYGIFYTIDFYFMYAVFKCIDYLERLECLWVHRK